jgi:hypothetical protein
MSGWISALAGAAHGQDIAISLFTGGQEWVRRDGSVELVFTRWPAIEEGQIAVVVGNMDRTELFRRTERGLAYRPELMPLPVGQSEIAVYLVGPRGDWRELGRLPLRVLRPGGVESASLTPRLDLGVKAQIAEEHSPPENRPPRENFEDLTFQLDLQSSAARSGWTLEPRFNVVGSSFEQEALRYSSEGEEAPRADLSAYGVRLSHGRASVQLGHLSYGENRLLMQGFATRGLQLTLPLGARASVALVAANGSQIVGWDNILGFQESEHRVLTGTVGVEMLARPGGLRLEGSYLDGKLQPLFSFNQSFVNDSEHAQGWGGRILAATPAQRFRLEGGYARTSFENPDDPTLSQGATLVPVAEEERDARYLELHFGLLQRSLGERGTATVNLSLKHNRVEPLYRTVGAYVQADRDETSAELQTLVGPAALSLAAGRWQDNLDDLSAVITTRNERQGANLALPLGQIWPRDTGPRNWLPVASYTLDRNHQRGLGIPPGSGLRPDHIADQVSLNQAAGLDWQAGSYRLGLRFGWSDQDNRQLGRERADFETATQALTAGGTLWKPLDLGVELARERSENLEQDTTRTQLRYGLNMTWRIVGRLAFTSIVSLSDAEDGAHTSESNAWNADLQLSWGFEHRRGERHGFSGQLFLRGLELAADSFDRTFGFATDTEQRTLNAGLTLSLF